MSRGLTVLFLCLAVGGGVTGLTVLAHGGTTGPSINHVVVGDSPGTVDVQYEYSGNGTAFLVATQADETVGWTGPLEPTGPGERAWEELSLDDPRIGTEITVTMYNDTNANGTYDGGDEVIVDGGVPVRRNVTLAPKTTSVSHDSCEDHPACGTPTTTTTTPSPSDTTTTSPDPTTETIDRTTTATGAPSSGFGLLAGVVALLAVALLVTARR